MKFIIILTLNMCGFKHKKSHLYNKSTGFYLSYLKFDDF
jgi:hypothetical protein